MNDRLDVLIAYPYLEKYGKDELVKAAADGAEYDLLLDSGAFTAWRLGRPIDLDAYCRFIETTKMPVWRYISLDVVGDHEATMANYLTMLRRGFDPIPVLTRGDTLDTLDFFFSKTDLVALGGVTAADRASYSWVRHVCEHAGKRKVHVLGYTNFNWIKYLKPYSCDSSSWTSALRYGRIILYMGQGRFIQVHREHFREHPEPHILAAIRALGHDPYRLMDWRNWRGGRSEAAEITLSGWLQAQAETFQRVGTRVFMATTTSSQFLQMRESWRNHLRRNHGGSVRGAEGARK